MAIVKVTPSILTNNINDFWQQIKRLLPYYQHFQVDIIDGKFASQKTITVDDILSTMQQHSHVTIKPLVFDFHLMVVDHEKEISKIDNLKIPIGTILIHLKNQPNLELLEDKYTYKFALTLDPDDSVEQLLEKYDLKSVQAIQIMSVVPGAQGQPFLPETLQKIEQLRNLGYRNKIYLDGGINEKTLPIIFSQKFRPDVIGPGSFFSKAQNIIERVDFISSLMAEIGR